MTSTLDTAQIASLAGLTRKHVTNRVVTMPGFPKPVVWISRQTRRWAEADVLAYFKAGPRSALASPAKPAAVAGAVP